jgi:AcrR family transcriptional regulator
MMKAKVKKKAASKRRAFVRGEPVVRGVLSATIEELSRVGYERMRIEDVAARAGVNKTTVYRRFTTKEELVRAALMGVTRGATTAPNTGSLRGDLLEHMRRKVSRVSSPEGQMVVRMLAAEPSDSELFTIAKSIHKAHASVPRSILESAAARGELAPGVDASLLIDILRSAVRDRIVFRREPVDDRFLERVVDLLLHGALRSGGGREPPA